ncbi:hypothetical protein PMZ80_010976 [Knufia obscura]|uniref:ER-bound oxygenase mpaB/mpaB'/Rubber oxygenase catalytic domain-containing protein n=1 Tax=Knufia obscura TaxID=1635080 RepID=A0ABR0R8A4_9EURO|nr:hypothetical protein PMZ80_010976 [Knufia obscura]
MLILTAVTLAVGYLLVVRALRFRRRNALQDFGYNDRPSFSNMTLKDAFLIQRPLAELEFPRTFSISVFFAIFKTYGIPSISSLLAATGQLSNPASASKRTADTGILIVGAVLNEPGTARNMDAVARMNFLHDRYRKAGKIKDDDMLYTLSLFALEPIRWTRNLEWRCLEDVELCAMGVYWKSMGDQMQISYDLLSSRKSGWDDGLQFLEDLETWSTAYEAERMVPAESNNKLAVSTINIALTNVPRVFHGLGHHFVSALLEPRLRRAMKLQEPSNYMVMVLEAGLAIRKFILRHLCLPRRDHQKELWFSDKADPSTGRYHAVHYIDRPWYIRPTFKNRWNMVSWLLWLVGGSVPSKSSPQNRPEGYMIPDLGPENMEGKGVEEMSAAKLLLAQQVKRCPFGHRAAT